MSATLAALLGIVAPGWSISVFESGPAIAGESSDPWNNAGTGHAALCELNYTPATRRPGGPGQGDRDQRAVPALPAVLVAPRAQRHDRLPEGLHHPGPAHQLRDRRRGPPLHARPLRGARPRTRCSTAWSTPTTRPTFAEWVPLMMAGRDPGEVIAATRAVAGTDVNFGALTRLQFADAEKRGVHVHVDQRVADLERMDDGRWKVTVKDAVTGEHRTVRPGSSSSAPAAARCRCCSRPASPRSAGSAASRSAASSCAPAPPSWCPGTRRRCTARPPSARRRCRCRTWTCAWSTASTRCCSAPTRAGPRSSSRPGRCSTCRCRCKPNNLGSMLGVARTELALTKYLIGELLQSRAARLRTLQGFVPLAEQGDWDMITAGQRVQVIKRDPARQGHPAVRHRTHHRRRRHHRRPARRLPGRLDGGVGDAHAAGALLPRADRRLAARAPGGHPLLRPQPGRRPELLAEVRTETMKTLELVG